MKTKGTGNSSLPVPLIFLEIATLIGLSSICGYELQKPGFVVNFDIALMLTPWGFFRNFVLHKDSWLVPFYQRQPLREGVFDSMLIFILTFAAAGLACGILMRLRRQTQK